MDEGRSELKYAVRVEVRDAILKAAATYVRADPHANLLTDLLPSLQSVDGEPPRGYRVCSLYLDTFDLSGYTERLAEARIRNRVRVRTYGLPGENATVFLESKRKLAQRVIKHREKVGTCEEWASYDSQHPWREAVARHADPKHFGERWLSAVDGPDMFPVCRVTYLRETWVDGEARLTLDHKVQASANPSPTDLQGFSDIDLIPEGWMVLELKFSGSEPPWMRRLVNTFHLAAEPVSKFALGVVKTLRADREGELRYLTPPSIQRARGAA
jgi:hypothetical protein